MATFNSQPQQTYDRRPRGLVRATSKPDLVAQLGVSPSTAVNWLPGEHRRVICSHVLDMEHVRLKAEMYSTDGNHVSVYLHRAGFWVVNLSNSLWITVRDPR